MIIDSTSTSLTQFRHSCYVASETRQAMATAARLQRTWIQRVPPQGWNWAIGLCAVWASLALFSGAWIASGSFGTIAFASWVGHRTARIPVKPVVPELEGLDLPQLRQLELWANEFVLVRRNVSLWIQQGRVVCRRDFDAIQAYVTTESEARRRHRVLASLREGDRTSGRAVEKPLDSA